MSTKYVRHDRRDVRADPAHRSPHRRAHLGRARRRADRRERRRRHRFVRTRGSPVVAVEPSSHDDRAACARRCARGARGRRSVAVRRPRRSTPRSRCSPCTIGLISAPAWPRCGASPRGRCCSSSSRRTRDLAWIVTDYFPEILDQESERNAPGVADIARYLDVLSCRAGARARRLHRRLRGLLLEPARDVPRPRRASRACRASRRWRPTCRARGIERLRAELADGTWDAKYGDLRAMPEHDLGYHVVVAR